MLKNSAHNLFRKAFEHKNLEYLMQMLSFYIIKFCKRLIKILISLKSKF